MSLKSKVLLILFGVFILYGTIDYIIQYYIIFPSFLELEKLEAKENLQRSIHSITREIDHIDSLCHDWAAWDDTYDFIKSNSEDYIESNLGIETFVDNDLSLVYFYDTNGSVFWGKAYDLNNEEEISIHDFSRDSLPQNHPLVKMDMTVSELADTSVTGIIITDNGPMMVSSRPIITSKNEGPIRGYLIMGQFLNDDLIKSLTEQTRVNFTIYTKLNSPGKTIKTAKEKLNDSFSYYIELTNDKRLNIYTTYPDIAGNPAFLIKTTIPRDIVLSGLKTLRFALISLLMAGICVVAVILYLLQRMIFNPITQLTNHTLSIGKTGNFSARLNMKRTDEIGTLGREFDRMVEMIEQQTTVMELVNEELTKDIAKRIKAEEALQEANQMLENLAMLDGLTQIANRRRFDEFLVMEWKRMMRAAKPLSLIICDVDFFKLYNDQYGHLAGDDCLRLIAQSIKSQVKRSSDFAARYGGEEFAIILPETNKTGALNIAESIREGIRQLKIPHASSAVDEYVTLSLGVSTLVPIPELSHDSLVDLADKALYEAKASGRNCSVAKAA
jgi:diguanylate cyclase (GGDEF)-like protein